LQGARQDTSEIVNLSRIRLLWESNENNTRKSNVEEIIELLEEKVLFFFWRIGKKERKKLSSQKTRSDQVELPFQGFDDFLLHINELLFGILVSREENRFVHRNNVDFLKLCINIGGIKDLITLEASIRAVVPNNCRVGRVMLSLLK